LSSSVVMSWGIPLRTTLIERSEARENVWNSALSVVRARCKFRKCSVVEVRREIFPSDVVFAVMDDGVMYVSL